MLRQGLDALEQRRDLVIGPRLKAQLSRSRVEGNVVPWMPQWTPSNSGAIAIHWEMTKSLPAEILDAISRSRFHTDCGPAMVQHVWYTADNQLFLFNYLTGGLKIAQLSTRAAITAVAAVENLPSNDLPGRPDSLLVVATATEILLFGLLPRSMTTSFEDTSSTVVFDSAAASADGLHESVYYLTQLDGYQYSTGSRYVTHISVMRESARVFVSLRGDGVGIHELLYLRQSHLTLERVALPGGGCPKPRLAGVVGSFVSAFAEIKHLLSAATLPSSSSHLSKRLKHLVAVSDALLVAVDAEDNTRVYVATPPLPVEKVSPEVPFLSTMTSRKRRLPVHDEAAPRPARFRTLSGQATHTPSTPGASRSRFDLASVISLAFLETEAFKGNHTDLRSFSTEAAETVCDASVQPSFNPDLFVLTLTTSGQRRFDVVLDLTPVHYPADSRATRGPPFHFDLLTVQRVAFPMSTPSTTDSGLSWLAAGASHDRPMKLRHWKDGPLYFCAASVVAPATNGRAVTTGGLALGLHPSVSPRPNPTTDFVDDGWVATAVGEAPRLVTSTAHCQREQCGLVEGSTLLDIAFDAYVREVSSICDKVSGPCMAPMDSPRSSSTPTRSYWVFFDTGYRKLHITWLKIDALPDPFYLGSNLIVNVSILMRNKFNLVSVPASRRVALHPEGARRLCLEEEARLALRCGQLPLVVPAPALDALSDVLLCLTGTALYAPILAEWRPGVLPPFSLSRERLRQMRDACRALFVLANAAESKSFLCPVLLADRPSFEELCGSSPSSPPEQIAAVDVACVQDGKLEQNMLYASQRQRISGLVAVARLLGQLAGLLLSVDEAAMRWRRTTAGGSGGEGGDENGKVVAPESSLWDHLVARNPRLRCLCEIPLLELLTSSELGTFARAFVDMLVEAAYPESSATSDWKTAEIGNLPTDVAKQLLRRMAKNNQWLMPESIFAVTVQHRIRLGAMPGRSDEERGALICQAVVAMMTPSETELWAASYCDRLMLIETAMKVLADSDLLVHLMKLTAGLLSRGVRGQADVVEMFEAALGRRLAQECVNFQAAKIQQFVQQQFKCAQDVDFNFGFQANHIASEDEPSPTRLVDLQSQEYLRSLLYRSIVKIVMQQLSAIVMQTVPVPSELHMTAAEWSQVFLAHLASQTQLSCLNAPVGDALVNSIIVGLAGDPANIQPALMFLLLNESITSEARWSALFTAVQFYRQQRRSLEAQLILVCQLPAIGAHPNLSVYFFRRVVDDLIGSLMAADADIDLLSMAARLLMETVRLESTSAGEAVEPRLDLEAIVRDLERLGLLARVAVESLLATLERVLRVQSDLSTPISGDGLTRFMRVSDFVLPPTSVADAVQQRPAEGSARALQRMLQLIEDCSAEGITLPMRRELGLQLLRAVQAFGMIFSPAQLMQVCRSAGFVHLIPSAFYLAWLGVPRMDSRASDKMAQEFVEVLVQVLLTPPRGLLRPWNYRHVTALVSDLRGDVPQGDSIADDLEFLLASSVFGPAKTVGLEAVLSQLTARQQIWMPAFKVAFYWYVLEARAAGEQPSRQWVTANLEMWELTTQPQSTLKSAWQRSLTERAWDMSLLALEECADRAITQTDVESMWRLTASIC